MTKTKTLKLGASFALICAAIVSYGCNTTHNADGDSLQAIIEQRSESDQRRDQYRNPYETLLFFGIRPGMTVVEVLPGGGWYSKILAPYLGSSGQLHAANYPDAMWPLFGYMSPEFVAKRQQQMREWPDYVGAWGGNPEVTGSTLATLPANLDGSVDAVLFIRAMHNLARFESEASSLSTALQASYRVLKPGGVIGVVQHRAPESADDDWASGRNGYLKQSAVVAAFQSAGFKRVASSEINANPKDQPGAGDNVWRLPPSLRVKDSSDALKAANRAIGESDRMTLLFRKPGY